LRKYISGGNLESVSGFEEGESVGRVALGAHELNDIGDGGVNDIDKLDRAQKVADATEALLILLSTLLVLRGNEQLLETLLGRLLEKTNFKSNITMLSGHCRQYTTRALEVSLRLSRYDFNCREGPNGL